MDLVLTLLGPLLVAAGLGLHFLTTFQLARYRKYPWGFFGLSVLGSLLSVYRVATEPSIGTAIAVTVSLALFGFIVWYLFVYSVYPPRESRPAVGDRFPEFSLRDTEGNSFSLPETRGRPLVLLLYRGSW